MSKKQWVVYQPQKHAVLANELNSLDSALEECGILVSRGRQSQVFRRELGDKIYYVKQYTQALGLNSWLGCSRGEVEQRNLLWFAKQGLPVCEVAAFGIEKKGLKTQRTVLVTEAVNNTQDLEHTARNNTEFKINKHWRRTIIDSLAKILRHLHAQRFCHNDFQWRNILLNQDSRHHLTYAGISLIDCPFGRRFFWPMLNYRKIKDLANLDEQARQHLSQTERLRFYKSYKNIKRLSKAHKKEITTLLKRYP